MTQIIFKGKIVKTEMEKPESGKFFDLYGNRLTLLYNSAMIEYNAHLSTLPGIECSPELLAKFKDGDEVNESEFEKEPQILINYNGNDEWIKIDMTTFLNHPRRDHVRIIAVPVQSDEEERMSFDELKYAILKAPKIKSEYRQAAIVIIRDIFQQYKLTKRC